MTGTPYILSPETIRSQMKDVLIALIPAMLLYLNRYGWYGFLMLAVLSAATVGGELFCRWITGRILGRSKTEFDGSCLVTGILIALLLTKTIPLWVAALAGFAAIVSGKEFFGGIGKNFVNPAAFALAALSLFNVWEGLEELFYWNLPKGSTVGELLHLLLGNRADTGMILYSAAFLAGGIYLIYRGVSDGWAALPFLLTFYIVCSVGAPGAHRFLYATRQTFYGWTMAGAFFFLGDPVTTPVTVKGRIGFGVIAGLIAGWFRVHGMEGTVQAVLLAGLFVPVAGGMWQVRILWNKMKGEWFHE